MISQGEEDTKYPVLILACGVHMQQLKPVTIRIRTESIADRLIFVAHKLLYLHTTSRVADQKLVILKPLKSDDRRFLCCS